MQYTALVLFFSLRCDIDTCFSHWYGMVWHGVVLVLQASCFIQRAHGVHALAMTDNYTQQLASDNRASL